MSEKNITSLNTIKTWFKTGLKPTQSQFWAWLDSFYHKDEEIPQEKIKGLSDSLEAKADAEQLDHKANANASGLSEEDILAWKEALDVGELPTNIALIDEVGNDGHKEGNVYTKTRVNELLREKLDQPTQTATTTEAPFVVGVNADNESYKLPAGDLGKNIGNTDLIIPEGNIRILDTTGAKFQIKGLADKSRDASFNLRLKVNERGEVAYSNEADITFTMPETSTITVNHLYPSNIPSPPSYAEAFRNAFERAKNRNWQILTREDLELITANGLQEGILTFYHNGYFSAVSNTIDGANPVVQILTRNRYSNTENFQFRLDISNVNDGYHGGGVHMGLGYLELNNIRAVKSSGQYASFGGLSDTHNRRNMTFIFTKVEEIIYVTGYCQNSNNLMSIGILPELKDLVFRILLNKGTSATVRLSYKDLN